jgi:hypothetical protein
MLGRATDHAFPAFASAGSLSLPALLTIICATEESPESRQESVGVSLKKDVQTNTYARMAPRASARFILQSRSSFRELRQNYAAVRSTTPHFRAELRPFGGAPSADAQSKEACGRCPARLRHAVLISTLGDHHRCGDNRPGGNEDDQVQHRGTRLANSGFRRAWRHASAKTRAALRWMRAHSPNVNHVLAFANAALVIIGYFALRAAIDATETSERAWLAPVDAVLAEPLQKDKQVQVAIVFENSGKEPALNVVNVASGGFTLPVSSEEAARQQMVGPAPPIVDPCVGLLPQRGFPIVYPSTVQHLQTVIRQALTASDSVLTGKSTAFVHGCAAYETFGRPHYSEYCFWLGPRVDPTTGNRKFQPCFGGNRAD